MRRTASLLAVGLIALTTRPLSAQVDSGPSNPTRKITFRIAPLYPELGKKMHIRGLVRIEAVVRPNGVVKSTRVLGGNPVLVDSAMDAVGKWRFAAAQAETTEVVQVVFEDQ